MIKFKHKGNFLKTDKFLTNALKPNYLTILRKYGKEGVKSLSSETPIDSGETANSWDYRIVSDKVGVRIEWFNSNIVDGVPIAIILQYGHATNNGGYVQGRDYINPTLQPIFDNLAQEIWREVTK